MALEVGDADDGVGVDDLRGDLDLAEVLEVDRHRREAVAPQAAADDHRRADRRPVEAVGDRRLVVARRLAAAADVERVRVDQERPGPDAAHPLHDAAHVHRAHVRGVAQFAEVDLHGDQLLAADLLLESGLGQQQLELREDVLLRAAAHVGEPDLRRRFLGSLLQSCVLPDLRG